MFDAIETRDVGEFTVKVIPDDSGSAESPRDWAPLGKFFGFHNRYASPDKPPAQDPQEARAIAERGDNICLPVWMYDHSGTCYRAAETNPFSCPWDSGCFGFIYITRREARNIFGWARITEERRQQVLQHLKSEVKEYSAWANGEVYGFVVEDSEGDEVDSCWGFIGDPEYAMEAGIDAAGCAA